MGRRAQLMVEIMVQRMVEVAIAVDAETAPLPAADAGLVVGRRHELAEHGPPLVADPLVETRDVLLLLLGSALDNVETVGIIAERAWCRRRRRHRR